jgi:mono/diheme cytochrome c family protein
LKTAKILEMKKNKIIALFTVIAVVFFAACGGGGSTEKAQAPKEEPKKEEVKPAETSGLAAQLELGEKIYKEKCIVCHQADAKGVQDAFPPLANADYLLADLKRGVAQTLNGSHEEMVINGATYNAPMTPQVQTLEEAVSVINYVLKEFNGYTDDKLIKMEDVADIEINPMQL